MLVENFSNAEVLKTYAGKRVFITGHTGFKGSWLSLMLHRAGAVLKGYALAPDHPDSLFENLSPHIEMESVIADISDQQKVMKEIAAFRPDFIFHLAAQPLVRYSYTHPVETFRVNVMGTVHVLEALRELNHPCTTVVVTTDKVYENNETGLPFTENNPLGGHDPYSSSKAAAEIVTQSYQKSFFSQSTNSPIQPSPHSTNFPIQPTPHSTNSPISIATARAGNVIGGGDRATDRIIPDLIKSLEENKTLTVRNPQAIRPWQHVLDPLNGYLRLAALLNTDAEKYTGSYNFGPLQNDQFTVKEIVEMAIKQWGKGSYQSPALENQPHEASNLQLDISKALTQLNWKPVWNAQKAIEKTINWYKNQHNNPHQSFALCVDDLEEFYKN